MAFGVTTGKNVRSRCGRAAHGASRAQVHTLPTSYGGSSYYDGSYCAASWYDGRVIVTEVRIMATFIATRVGSAIPDADSHTFLTTVIIRTMFCSIILISYNLFFIFACGNRAT